ncbi:MAG: double-strand break repair helicase AddA [Alphaproteobacteria bacterium]|jgi:ATP-dependent helicase/nuclease subunit A|nr:double-strand break repair helicase AddA [Alphaproteobacteria bacterium]
MSAKSTSPIVKDLQQGGRLIDVDAAQQRASDPHQSVWVSASAGSGKTKVLADRVTRLLLDGVRPERILCLTFTRAAAAEMAIRITNRLSLWATCSEQALEQELDKLQGVPSSPSQRALARRLFATVLQCPGGMRIQTIHSFAQEILGRFPLEAGLPPQFTVMEEAEAQALWQNVFNNALQTIAQGGRKSIVQAFATLSTSLAQSTLTARIEDVKKQYKRLNTAIELHGSLDTLCASIHQALGLDPGETLSSLMRKAAQEKNFERKALLHAAQLLVEKGGTKSSEAGRKMLQWLALDARARAATLDNYIDALLTKDGKPRAHVPDAPVKKADPSVQEVIAQETQRLVKVLDSLNRAQCATETAAVLHLGLFIVEEYTKRKTQRGLLDYDDLIARTVTLLSRENKAQWVLYKLDGGIDHMLVDEGQDTNPAQWQIVKILADEYFVGETARSGINRTLFVVGDEKQSIYSFLGADPDEFERMRTYFNERIAEALPEGLHQEPLNISFRSAPAILRAVDAVFDAEPVRRGVAHASITHTPFRTKAVGRVEVWPLFKSHSQEDAVSDEEKPSTTRLKEPVSWDIPQAYEPADDPAAEMAARVASQIRQWVERGLTVYDSKLGNNRSMGYGDIMVLVQQRDRFVHHLVRELKNKHVDVFGVDRMMLTEQLAVMDLTALLQFTLLPEDDLTLACVLRGPLIGASEDEMMTLAVGREGFLWDRLVQMGREPFARWHAYLKSLAALADQLPPLALLVHILSTPCPADTLSGRRAIAARLGPDAEDPIDELLNVAQSYSQHIAPSLQGFLHWVVSSDMEIKRELEQPEGRVRITTVHASKGLEAPIVILPDTLSVPDKSKIDKLLWDEKTGLPFYLPRETEVFQLKALRDRALERKLQEHRRLMYVALTRAADRLYIGGYEKRARKDDDEAAPTTNGKQSWYGLIQSALAPLHQEEAFVETSDVIQPHIVVADAASLARLPVSKRQRDVPASTNIPAWAMVPPMPEPDPPSPLVPSRPSAQDEALEPAALSPGDKRFARGRIIHRLLQSLPDIETARRERVAQTYLANPSHLLNQESQTEIKEEVLRLISDKRFAPLFGPNSRAEQPLIGRSGNRLIAGQVDRLAFVGNEVWIVDYKTNRPPPLLSSGIPAPYRAQMEAYRTVLRAIYPNRTVRCFLLWTYTPQMMEV